MFTYEVLVIADDGFTINCKDLAKYSAKLQEFLAIRAGDLKLTTTSVNGKFNYPAEKLIEVNDKNKTNFIKSINEVIEQFHEVVVLTNYPNDPYISALTNRLQEVSIQFTIYGYETNK